MVGFNRDFNEHDEIPVFDGGQDDHEEEGSNLPMVIVISLLVLAAFVGVVWVAYKNGVMRGHTELQPVQTAADVRPAAAPGTGDLAAPNRQTKAFQRPAGVDDDVAPAHEVKTAARTVTPPPVPATRPPAQLVPALPPATKPATVQPAAPVAPKLAQPAAKPVPVQPAPAKPVQAAAKTVPPPPAAKSVPAGAYVLQIGSYKSESDASAAWNTYRAKHAALLSGFASNIQKADLGEKGVWYRLRVGSFADKNAAAAACDKLKAEGGACFPSK
jgi:cell division protein FtsN